ncbi:MAG: hypothetical protein ACOCTI_03305 [Phycisphaeraceae bacterium]
MSKVKIKERLPWEDRWHEPSLEQLLEPQKATARKPLETILGELETIDNLDRELVWYGPAWRWTIQYALQGQQVTGENPAVAYIVPNPENALVLVPLTDEMVDELPMRRLNKAIREGIRSAKCAYQQHWATWSPSSQAEAENLVDLVRRKIAFVTGEEPADKKSD